MQAAGDIRPLLRDLLNRQRLAALATHRDGQPYANLVAFAASDDLRFLYFVTPRSTRKFGNLQGDCRVALLVSSSRNQETDFHEAAALTVLGSAAEITGPEKEAAAKRYIEKHPYLEDFVQAPTCAFVKVQVRTCILVKNFQQVMELDLAP
jgi:nitroimidazol reductase NimA-like FMN-containing flavoprotein (pyridoxamine 5'-phosphate oxidase superfamily)